MLHSFDENEILESDLYTDKLMYKLQSLFVYQNTSTIHSMGLLMSYSFTDKHQCQTWTQCLIFRVKQWSWKQQVPLGTNVVIYMALRPKLWREPKNLHIKLDLICVCTIFKNPLQYKQHYTFKQINQSDASTSQIYCSSFKYSSTCFGHPHAHHQELINCSSLLRFTVGTWW